MTQTYIKFENRTNGEKAVALLKKHSINARLKRNPNPDRRQGCNYALFCPSGIWEAYEIIEKNHIRNRGVESSRDRL